jgi:hypothetical protein
MTAFEPAVPTLQPLMRITINLALPQVTGDVPLGLRRIIAIAGGSFEGQQLRGVLLPGGGDWQLSRHDAVAEVDARFLLQTDDGALIYAQDKGLRHGPAAVMARLASGAAVDPKEYYFRTSMQLETAHPDYAWLNRQLVIGSGMRANAQVIMDLYSVT